MHRESFNYYRRSVSMRLSHYIHYMLSTISFFFFQAEDGIRDYKVTGVQTCALPISVLPACLGSFGIGGLRLWSLRRRTFVDCYRRAGLEQSAVKKRKEKRTLEPCSAQAKDARSAGGGQVYGIESQSRCRTAIRSKTDTLVIDASSRGELRPPASHPRHHRFRAQRSSAHHRPRPSHRLCSYPVRGRHHRSRGNIDSMGRHRPTPLSAEASRKKHHKTCEDDLTDHGSHLKARPAEPFLNNPSPIPKMRPEQHWFQFNSLLWRIGSSPLFPSTVL